MKTELEQLKEDYLSLGKRIEELEKQPKKPKLEANKWYRIHYTGQHCNGLPYFKEPFYIVRFREMSYENTRAEFNLPCGKNVMMAVDECFDWLEGLATPEEVKTALIKEAERKYHVPVKLKYIDGKTSLLIGHSLKYNHHKDILYATDCQLDIVYQAGQWATIITEPEITIGGYKVEFEADQFEKNKFNTTIDGHFFHRNFWRAALTIAENSKACVKVGCSKQFEVDKETIKKILDKINK